MKGRLASLLGHPDPTPTTTTTTPPSNATTGGAKPPHPSCASLIKHTATAYANAAVAAALAESFHAAVVRDSRAPVALVATTLGPSTGSGGVGERGVQWVGGEQGPRYVPLAKRPREATYDVKAARLNTTRMKRMQSNIEKGRGGVGVE